MTKEDIMKEWNRLNAILDSKESQLTTMTTDWLNSLIEMSDEQFFQEADKLEKEISQLKTRTSQLISEHTWMCIEEARKEQEIKNAKRNVMDKFGTNPDKVEITGGVLSSNAAESHLVGITRTPEQLEQERQLLLNRIKEQVIKQEITLPEASQWKNYINIAYGYSSPVQDMTNTMHK